MLAMDSSTVIGTGMPRSSRGPSKFSISWFSHMTGDIDAVGRQQAFLPFAFRAGFKAFAMMLRAGVAVVLQQRDGVVDLFCTANGRLQTRQLHRAKRDCCKNPLSSTPPARTPETDEWRPSGKPLRSGRRRCSVELNCQASSPVFRSVSTVRAFDGQALTQAAQPMHCCGLCSGLPRKFYPPASAPAGSGWWACRF